MKTRIPACAAIMLLCLTTAALGQALLEGSLVVEVEKGLRGPRGMPGDIVQLDDGRVMMFARTYSGFPVRAYSDDGCETWSEGEPIKELPMPYAGLPTVRRIPSTGDLLFIWISERSVDKNDPKIARRCALSTAISKDEGKTFGPLRPIARDPEDDFGYQCIEFLADDLALVAYHARDGLHVARIHVDWFYGR